MSVPTLNPALVVMSFKGMNIQDFADGTFIEVEYDEDQTTEHVGANGNVTRVINNNQLATITITLGQASPSNGLLSAIANLDRKTGGGVGSISIEDLSGDTIYSGKEAWIKKIAKGEHAKEHTNRKWVFKVAKLKANVAGVSTQLLGLGITNPFHI